MRVCQEAAAGHDFPGMTALLSPEITIGAPDVAGALTVFPLFGPAPRLEYLSYAEAASLGARVTELPGGASVNDLLVHNPLGHAVLLYEGEELVGAQQDRTVDAAVLVPAGADLQVAVSCVEHGRWDGRRHAEPFAASPHAAFPALRAAKNARIREQLAGGREGRADQQEVWQAVAEVAADAPTQAMGRAFERPEVDELRAGIPRHDGQCGALAAIAGRFVVLDYVSRADVFAALHGPLVSGYALDAAGAGTGPAAREPEGAVRLAFELPRQTGRSAGLGEHLHFERGRVAGTGLSHDGELIQLSAFFGPAPRARRIRRPSQRG